MPKTNLYWIFFVVLMIAGAGAGVLYRYLQFTGEIKPPELASQDPVNANTLPVQTNQPVADVNPIEQPGSSTENPHQLQVTESTQPNLTANQITATAPEPSASPVSEQLEVQVTIPDPVVQPAAAYAPEPSPAPAQAEQTPAPGHIDPSSFAPLTAPAPPNYNPQTDPVLFFSATQARNTPRVELVPEGYEEITALVGNAGYKLVDGVRVFKDPGISFEDAVSSMCLNFVPYVGEGCPQDG